MNESSPDNEMEAIDRAIALAEAALQLCDDHGYIFAAIDLSSALDKLTALKNRSEGQQD
jgi:hypothetical protein